MSNSDYEYKQRNTSRPMYFEQRAQSIMGSNPEINPVNLIHALDAEFVNEFKEILSNNDIHWDN